MLGLVSKKKVKECQDAWTELNHKMQFDIDRLQGEIKNKNKIAFDLNNQLLDLRKENQILKNTNRDLGNTLDIKIEEILELKEQVKKLKSLCTRNNIDYSKLFSKKR